jgi:hypothetical protein
MPTTIFSPSVVINSDAGVGSGWSFRSNCTLTGASLGQIRITLSLDATGAGSSTFGHVGVAITGVAPATGTFSEFLWSSSPGVTVPNNSISTPSDWLTFACLSTDHLMIGFEYTSGAGGCALSNSNSNCEAWNQHATGVWNDTTGVGWNGAAAGTDYLVFLIETQSGAPPVTLMGAICM